MSVRVRELLMRRLDELRYEPIDKRIRALLGDRLEISVGVDDAILEGIGVGATGWIAGLANALIQVNCNTGESSAQCRQRGARSG